MAKILKTKQPYEVLNRTFKGQVPLNRSRKWTYASTYQQAREQSPSSRPVR